MAGMGEVEGWARGLDELAARIGPHFGRVEPRRRALAYLRGLFAPMKRKNGWQLAEAAGDRTPDGVQDFLSRMRWDADAVRDDLRAYVVEHLGDPGAVLVLDETGFVKKGTKSAGVQRQYSGTAGRIENCQIGVVLGYASRHGRALIDRALYLPESWTKAPERRAEAGIPEDVRFTTKPKLGRAMLARGALEAEVPFAWVTADSVYGGDYALRRWLQDRRLGYVPAVTSAQRLGFGRVDAWAKAVPSESWHRLSAGDGAKGPRLYDWAYATYPSDAVPGWKKGLLIRRPIAEPDELAFYLTHAPDTVSLEDLVRVAGMRWTIEACFEAAKGESRPRRVRGALVDRLAPPHHAGPAGARLPRRGPQGCGRGGEVELDLAAALLPLTVPEIRRLLWCLVWVRPPEPGAALAWSRWRRRHQQRAGRCHWRRQTHPEPRLQY